MRLIQPKTTEFGKAFEHFLINEIRAYFSYRNIHKRLSFWRTRTHDEIDLIVGDMECAIEFKAKELVTLKDADAFDRLHQEFVVPKNWIISLDESPRKLSNNVDVMPWRYFLTRLWAGELF
jgi:predicted AAA+ superfamily ATPase